MDRPAAAAAPRPAAAGTAPGRPPRRRSTWPRRPRRRPGSSSRTTAAFAAKALAAARTGLDRGGRANPTGYASESDGTGGGAYDDNNVTDEFYWAAAELFITTGEKEYARATCSPPRTTPPTCSAHRRLRLGVHRRARPARPGHRAQQAARPTGSGSALGRRRARTSTWRTQNAQRVRLPYAPAEQHVRLGLEQHGAQQPGGDRHGLRPHRQDQVPRRRADGHRLPVRPQRAEPVLRHRLRRGQPRTTSTAAGTPTSSTRACPTRRAGTLAGGPNSLDPGPATPRASSRAASASSATSTTSSRGRPTS